MSLTEHVFCLFLISATFQVLLAKKLVAKDFENQLNADLEKELERVDDIAYILIKAHKQDGDIIYHAAVYDIFEGYYTSFQRDMIRAERVLNKSDLRSTLKKTMELYQKKRDRLLDRFFDAGIPVNITTDYQYGLLVRKRSSPVKRRNKNRRRQKNKRTGLQRHDVDELKRIDAAASIIADAYTSDDEKINPDAVYDLFESYYEALESKWINHEIAALEEDTPEDLKEILMEKVKKYKAKGERFLEKIREENVGLELIRPPALMAL